MKRFILLTLLIFNTVYAAETPFSRGVNLTSWLQASGPQQIHFNMFSRPDFVNIQSLGCDVVRLPINLHSMTDGPPEYTVSPLFFSFLDQIVDWTEELGLHLILDNHSFDPAANTDPDIGDVLIPVWTQMAEHYKTRSTRVYYEVLNEPHGISDALWNQIQQNVIAAIRTVDTTHTIVVGPAGWNSYNNLDVMPDYGDEKLIYTFHFYDPFVFTHQGASWTDPSIVSLEGVPFPYDAARMPDLPQELSGTWIQSALSSYQTDGTVQRVKQLIDIAVNFKNSRDVPIFCGEFGVYIPNSNNGNRVYWYDIVRSYLEEKGIAWTIWDYTGGFGLFEEGSNELFDYDLNVPMVGALGLTAPPQQEFVLRPDTTAFDLYGDYVGPNIDEASWSSNGLIDFYSDSSPVSGGYCMYWTGVDQYNTIAFNFKPNKDLSVLSSQGYAVDFWVRGSTPGSSFDIRFLDTKTDEPGDHPWRMGTTIDQSRAAWDGQWHHLQIPLASLHELGSWDDEWFNPQGFFDWQAVDRLEIVAEQSALTGIEFWFDDLSIVDPAVSSVQVRTPVPSRFVLNQNYPNPFNPSTTITFTLPFAADVNITVFDIWGRSVRTLADKVFSSGSSEVIWDGVDNRGVHVSSGTYIYRFNALGKDGKRYRYSRKMILAR